MGRNQQYTISEKGTGSASRRLDGYMHYLTFPVVPAATGSTFSCMFMYDAFNDELWSSGITGGVPKKRLLNNVLSNMKADHVNHILWFTNSNSGNSATDYPGNNAMYAVAYEPLTGRFLTTPRLVFPATGSTIDAVFPDIANRKLYFNYGNFVKRADYALNGVLSNVEAMGLPSANIKDIWKGSADEIVYADDGIGGVDKFATVLAAGGEDGDGGDTLGYLETDSYFTDGGDKDEIHVDETLDLMIVGASVSSIVKVMTFSDPTDATTLFTKNQALYGPWAIDDTNGHIYFAHFGDAMIYRSAYTTRALTTQIDILDLTQTTVGRLVTRLILG